MYGHLHIPRTTWYDGVRFEEVSVGYPREWRRRKPYRWMRQILPDPKYPPGYLNEFGGHFEITPEMRAKARRRCRSSIKQQSERDGARCSSGVLPGRVAAAELYDDPPDLAPLPEEEPLIARSVAKRRNEFITVRHCARQALAELGLPPVPILKGDKGEPCWPDGVVGQPDALRRVSAARSSGWRADVRSVGIDAEPHDVLPDGVLDADQPARRTRRAARAARWPALGSNPVLRQGGDVQGVVPADSSLAGFRGRAHHLRGRRDG